MKAVAATYLTYQKYEFINVVDKKSMPKSYLGFQVAMALSTFQAAVRNKKIL